MWGRVELSYANAGAQATGCGGYLWFPAPLEADNLFGLAWLNWGFTKEKMKKSGGFTPAGNCDQHAATGTAISIRFVEARALCLQFSAIK